MQQKNIQKLTGDLQAIKQGSQVTLEMKQALKNDLMAMAEGATKPDPALVDKLAADLADAMSDGNISNAEKAKLTNDLYAVMNSANIPASEVNQAVADAQVILAASGVTKQDAQAIANDMKAIVAEFQKNHPSAGTNASGTTRISVKLVSVPPPGALTEALKNHQQGIEELNKQRVSELETRREAASQRELEDERDRGDEAVGAAERLLGIAPAAKPADAKPADAKPADPKPADAPADDPEPSAGG